jgi:hypothetical protein
MEGDLEAMFMIALWLLILVGLLFLVKYFAESAGVDLDFSPKAKATLMDSPIKGENAFKKSKQESPN